MDTCLSSCWGIQQSVAETSEAPEVSLPGPFALEGGARVLFTNSLAALPASGVLCRDRGRPCQLGAAGQEKVPRKRPWRGTLAPRSRPAAGPFLRTQATAPPPVCLLIWCGCALRAPLASSVPAVWRPWFGLVSFLQPVFTCTCPEPVFSSILGGAVPVRTFSPTAPPCPPDPAASHPALGDLGVCFLVCCCCLLPLHCQARACACVVGFFLFFSP